MAKRNEKGQFVKGSTGKDAPNPNGRPKKGETMTDALREFMEQPYSTRSKKSNKQMLIEKMLGMALSDDAAAAKYIFDRLDGKPHQTIAQTNLTFEDVEVTVEGMDEDNL